MGTAFFDAQGNFQRTIGETNAVGTNSANGITLRETDHFVDFFNSAGYDKEVGLPIHIQDGGVVIRDAGYISSTPTDQLPSSTGRIRFLKAIPLPIARR